MKKIKLITICLFVLALAISPPFLFGQIEYPEGYAEDGGLKPLDFSRVGVAGWQFLKLPTSARQAGMGGVLS